ncbi:MAG: hypothetical protein ACI4CS_10770 [Candidatus Weimeria sp.]
MILKKFNNGLMAMVLSSVAVFSLPLSNVSETTANAAEQSSYVVIDNEVVVPYGIDYYNEQTGEYFRWEVNHSKVNSLSATTAHNFSYKVQYSVTSSPFNISSSTLKVVSHAHIEDYWGNYSTANNTGHEYTVEVYNSGLIAKRKTFNFSIGKKESGSASGFNADKTCRVCITNTDAVSDINYLAGYGTVYNIK